jgi:hypothetical protein
MNNDHLKMSILVNGIAVGLLEKIALKLSGDDIQLDFGSGNSKKRVRVEGKPAASLRDRIKKTKLPLASTDIPAEDFSGVTFDVTAENKYGKMHFRWVNKASGMEDLQTLIAEIMKLNVPEKTPVTGKKK